MRRTVLSLALAALALSGCAKPSSSADEGGSPEPGVTSHSVRYSPAGLKQGKKAEQTVFFSPDYFSAPSTVYNAHLATASMAMASCSMPSAYDGTPRWYGTQTEYITGFFEALGFDHVRHNADYADKSSFSSIGLCAAKRSLTLNGESYTLLAVVPRSGNYYREWANNMYLGDGWLSDYMHEGWYYAAKKLIAFLGEYIVAQGVTGKLKLWMSGFSRGGAVTNLAAGLIDNAIDRGEAPLKGNATLEAKDLFAYTFEAPQGANVHSTTVKPPKDPIYDNIFNIVNPNDIVPKLAPIEYGFTRFGRDRFITTRFLDPEHYAKHRSHLSARFGRINRDLDSDPIVQYQADDFVMHGCPIEHIPSLVTGDPVFEKDDTKANYDPNIAGMLLLEEFVGNVGDRDAFCANVQDNLKGIMEVLTDQEYFPDFALGLAAIGYILLSSIVWAASGGAMKLPDLGTKFKLSEQLVETLTGLVRRLSGPLFSTYWEKPNELISIAKYVGPIFQNHYPQIILAHMQIQDSYHVAAHNRVFSLLPIDVVPLEEGADYGRASFFGFNDVDLVVVDHPPISEWVVSLSGYVFGKSEVKMCKDRYAVGYYSYATEEKAELFFPVGHEYTITMKSYSKKPSHRVEYWAYWQGVAPVGTNHKRQIAHIVDEVSFNSDFYKSHFPV